MRGIYRARSQCVVTGITGIRGQRRARDRILVTGVTVLTPNPRPSGTPFPLSIAQAKMESSRLYVKGSRAGFQGFLSRSMALSQTSSFLMQATKASFFARPPSTSLS
jgi:hypothetical protein